MNKGDKVGLASTFEALMKLLKNKIFYKLERTSEELEEVVGGLGKNKLHNTSVGGWAQQIRYFTNSDGSMRFVAGSKQLARANVIINDHVTITEDMILTGCAAGGAAGTYKLQIKRNDDESVYADDIGSGVNVPVSTFGNGTCTVQVCLYKNLEFSQDLMFYPMLRAANVADATFEPYYNKLELGPSGEQSDWTESDSTSLAFIKNKPTLGTAAAKDTPSSGDASATQVVMGNDSRLSDARPASDVSSWAKASTKPTYTAAEVGAIESTDKGVANGVASLGSDGKVPSSQLPASSGPYPYTSDPAMDGTASSGVSNNYARGDHVHPVDTSRASATDLANGLAKRNNLFYATCSTAASTEQKTVTLADSTYTPVAGDLFVIDFVNGHSPTTQVYLNINNKGSYPIEFEYSDSASLDGGIGTNTRNAIFRFTGSKFVVISVDYPTIASKAERADFATQANSSKAISVIGPTVEYGYIKAQTTDPGAGSSLATGDIVFVYEA